LCAGRAGHHYGFTALNFGLEAMAKNVLQGVTIPAKKYDMREMASGDVIVCATGVTDSALLAGVRFKREIIVTETVIGGGYGLIASRAEAVRTGLPVSANRSPLGPKQHSMENVFDR
jgi:hypothetical protein